jgi:hypothetical protein
MSFLSIDDGDDSTDARALIKLGFGGTGGFDRPFNDAELGRVGNGGL